MPNARAAQSASTFPPKIVNVVHQALKARLLGASIIHSGFDSLDSVLNLQFRLHYHVIGSRKLAKAVCDVLLKDSKRLEENLSMMEELNDYPEIARLVERILFNCFGMLLFYRGQFQESQRYLLHSLKIHNDTTSQDTTPMKQYDQYLILENLYYRGLVSQDTNIMQNIFYKELLTHVNTIPQESNGLLFEYINMIVAKLRFSQIQDLADNFKTTADSPFILFLYVMKEFQTPSQKHFDNDDLYLKLGQNILSRTKFPAAGEANSENLEHFNVFLQYYFKFTHIKNTKVNSGWYSFIVSSMEKTFQSIEISKTAMILFQNLSRNNSNDEIHKNSFKRESILNFANFVKYNDKYYQLNDKSHRDIISLIDAYAFILQDSSKVDSIENLFDYDNTVSTFAASLNSFYKEYNLPLMSQAESLDWLENSTRCVYPENISEILVNAWSTLYEIRKFQLDFLISNDLTSYLCNAMMLSTKEKEIAIDKENAQGEEEETLRELQFKFSYTLAQQRHIEAAIKTLESLILSRNPNYYKAWHLLALCRSVQEDKEISYKIVCSVLEAMSESFQNNTLLINDRWQFIHLKLTQVAIIEEIFGTLEALETLPEVFELYTTLFPDSQPELNSMGPKYSQTKEYLLQMIWIFAANMYMRTKDNDSDAKAAIKEAIHVESKFKNLNCNIANGYLSIIKNEPNVALKEFETVLYYDENNLDALIGFAALIFPEELDKEERNLESYYTLSLDKKPTKSARLTFVNETDRSAAYARLKFLLECAILESVEAYHCPDVWWYLSLIYEKYQDDEYKSSLLKCVKYQELNPIRSLRYCNY
ncbi:Ypp1p [Saccharomyces cerevisiae x Saccharomyces kudriavzevii VIN7]|uniref:Cargo-transport protein YPP1 n=1 Tax=Saccharomyces cerevisiae x Saccharomyces kudriavzevii (strain VIN7) TaxID=1095631 RepID=H0GVA8_SACCK|nr:Ypp1p [Saccharomyces cerevisiae x Saccharomyces kudriavzevii VIN7]CAI5275142.1 AIS_HP2_G0020680.mRNA.1.CDS.1 [Saccharomyces cerevisiae]CAI6529850.1 AIS_HP2_G0020680.mRNA.1.CDS.1 [Saccharomyces cerevisiae]